MKELTEAQLFLVDYALAHIPLNSPFVIKQALHNILFGKSAEDFSPGVFQEIVTIVQMQEATVAKLLRDLDYCVCTDIPYARHELTANGKKAKELGGHQQFLAWAEKEAKSKKTTEWVKRNPILYDVYKWLFDKAAIPIGTLILGIFIGHTGLKCNQQSPSVGPKQDSAQLAPKTSKPQVQVLK